MDETGAHYTEWSKSEGKTPMQHTNTYIWNLERCYRWPYMWDSKRDTDVKNSLLNSVGKGEGGMTWEGGAVYYHTWSGSQVQVDACDRALRAGALGWPWEMGWGGRWEGGSGWGTHVRPWLIHVNVWQNPLKYCKVISLQLK